ncbi:unnamed protein product [Hymenolepis diminuta]|uniref:Uncharacterized protein n=1 Tax=Hymenolepis diminuta TaxID=6216 RepID=A0A564YYM8_HYMDI|nr:unnamed protein product [Hymenolepis diminuta]
MILLSTSTSCLVLTLVTIPTISLAIFIPFRLIFSLLPLLTPSTLSPLLLTTGATADEK